MKKKEQRPLNHEQQHIRNWLKEVRFKKAVFGGVEESDVWKKIEELNTLYEAALSAERARYDALLAERVPLVARQMVEKMQKQAMSSKKQENAGDERDK